MVKSSEPPSVIYLTGTWGVQGAIRRYSLLADPQAPARKGDRQALGALLALLASALSTNQANPLLATALSSRPSPPDTSQSDGTVPPQPLSSYRPAMCRNPRRVPSRRIYHKRRGGHTHWRYSEDICGQGNAVRVREDSRVLNRIPWGSQEGRRGAGACCLRCRRCSWLLPRTVGSPYVLLHSGPSQGQATFLILPSAGNLRTSPPECKALP